MKSHLLFFLRRTDNLRDFKGCIRTSFSIMKIGRKLTMLKSGKVNSVTIIVKEDTCTVLNIPSKSYVNIYSW